MALITLTEGELSRYNFWPHQYYYCELGLNGQELSETDEVRFKELIINKFEIPKKHQNFLKWSFALLKNETAKKVDDVSKAYLDAIKAAYKLDKLEALEIIKIQIKGSTKDNQPRTEFLPIFDKELSNDILEIIKPYIKELSADRSKIKKVGRPQGKNYSIARDESLSVLAHNLVINLRFSTNKAIEILFQYGVLLNLWKAECPKGRYNDSQQEYKGKMVNVYFKRLK